MIRIALFAALAALPLVGCNTMNPLQVANVTCTGALAGAAVAVTIATDANAGADTTKTATRAQQTASAIQKTISDTCPIIVQGVEAVSAAAAPVGGAGK